MMAPLAVTRKKLHHKFWLRGFTLKVDSLKEAAAFLAHFPHAKDNALDLLLDKLDKEPHNFSFLSSLPPCSWSARCGLHT
ncbi:hypothetical protein E2562_035463 [Oryza meyeriana var. granulata]|uniref:Uncharacterized protein n=1 Tax=Oryza meyeriana var. granulata TaxID=110450 RepID=A0A6G1CLA0_9ORYZ|nr:hypothetical protein E2562_035463 [Oryza meyeriana var. granulata]